MPDSQKRRIVFGITFLIVAGLLVYPPQFNMISYMSSVTRTKHVSQGY